jgi:hypothetical protein
MQIFIIPIQDFVRSSMFHRSYITVDVVEVEDGLDEEGGSGGLEGEDSRSLGDKDQGGGESRLIESDPMRLKLSE